MEIKRSLNTKFAETFGPKKTPQTLTISVSLVLL